MFFEITSTVARPSRRTVWVTHSLPRPFGYPPSWTAFPPPDMDVAPGMSSATTGYMDVAPSAGEDDNEAEDV